MRAVPSPWSAGSLEERIGGLLSAPTKPAARQAGAARLPVPAPLPSSTPPAPAQPRQPAPQQPAPPPRPVPRKPQGLRAGEEAAGAECRQQAAEREAASALAVAGIQERGGDQDGQGGGGQDNAENGRGEAGGASATATGTPSDDGLTPAELAALLPGAEASGVFEVVLPDGATLGVAVCVAPDAVSYLLTPGSEGLALRLHSQRMELAAQVERRIGRSVRLTVL